jgi:TPR repeat protein
MSDIAQLREEAEKGNSNAQFALAEALRQQADDLPGEQHAGEVWSQLYSEYFAWLEKAADQGHAGAQYELGLDKFDRWETGVGDENDLQKSHEWLRAAAEQGHAEACMELCYIEIEFGGLIPKVDFSDREAGAIKWYRRARELGHPHAPSYLMLGGPNLKWFFGTYDGVVSSIKRRAKRGVSEDQYHLGCLSLWNIYRAYAWFVVAAGCPPEETRRTLSCPDDWRTPTRGIRLLEQVFNDDERRLAHRLANYYAGRFSPKKGLWGKTVSYVQSWF